MEYNRKTELTCSFSDTEQETPMGKMIEAGYQVQKLNYQYTVLQIEEDTLETAINAIRALKIKGVALEGRYKREALPFLDEVSVSAEIAGQVSSVCNRDGRLLGENMEGKGLITALMNAGSFLKDKTVTILGTQTMAKAAAAECALAGAGKIYFVQQEKEEDQTLAKRIAMHTSTKVEYVFRKEEVEIPKETEILIFAVNDEQKGNPRFSKIHDEGWWKQITICDVAMHPQKSKWIEMAKEKGAAVIDGKEILVNQAALNYSFWTEHIAPIPLFYDILYKTLSDEKEEQEQKADVMMQGEKIDVTDQKLIEKMVEYYAGDPKRIQHFLKVYMFACLIGKAEKLDTDTLFILKTAAIVHDIGIRISEEKYGTSSGKYQEKEGPAVAEPLLRCLGYDEEVIDRVLFLIANHHTYGRIEGADYQILVEADFLVNLYEDNCNRKTVEHVKQNIFRTTAGRWYLEQMFLSESGNDKSIRLSE